MTHLASAPAVWAGRALALNGLPCTANARLNEHGYAVLEAFFLRA